MQWDGAALNGGERISLAVAGTCPARASGVKRMTSLSVFASTQWRGVCGSQLKQGE